MEPIRVLTVDRRSLIRTSVSGVLLSMAGIQVVGEAGDREAAVLLAKPHAVDVMLTEAAVVAFQTKRISDRAS
jgi:chemotaxis response regulator CheB